MSCADKLDPIWIRPLTALVDDDFYHVTILKNAVKRSDLFVDLGAGAAISDGGVYRVRKVDTGALFRKVNHITLWCEYEDTIVEHIDLHLFE